MVKATEMSQLIVGCTAFAAHQELHLGREEGKEGGVYT